jgi:DNA-binding SARP family transcriptional activator
MLTYRNSPLDREQILEFLWPDTEPITAQRNFKVALSTLLNVLEPFREPGSESAFILREGKVYGLRPGADIGLDAEEFLSSVKQAEETAAEGPEKALAYLEKAVDLYQGIFLPEARYENWATEEREHLAVRFLQVADQLSELYLEHNRAEDTIHLAQRILTYDNCWERAYRHLMKAYGQLGDHGQIARIYQRCIQTLREELDVSPSPETEALYSRLTEI